MRYGSYANEDGQPEQKWHATVQNDNAIESQRLALRLVAVEKEVSRG